MTKQPIVTLFTHTSEPLRAIALAIDIWHHPIPSHIEETIGYPYNWTEDKLVDKFRWLMKQPHQTPLEYFSMVWVFKNVSRAWQQQLTRHRLASYSIQSLRVVDPGEFAKEGRYHCPESVKEKDEYHGSMELIESIYRNMIDSGETTEDARGILPLNIHSPVTMCINYRALVGLLKQRLCIAAQEEWRSVAQQMREELIKVHPVFGEPLDCICGRFKNAGREMICRTTGKKVMG